MSRQSKIKAPRSQSKATKIDHVFPKNLATYLGQKGYTLPKSELSPEDQTELRKMLVARPIVHGAGAQPSEEFPIYRESAQKFYVPRFFGQDHFGVPQDNKLLGGDDIDLPFCGNMRPIQEMVIAKYMGHVSHPLGGGGLLELFCGFGKTICALSIISRLRKKTIIIVHKEFLMNQWIERIQQFLPNARIGKIQGQIIDIDNKDIVIGMLQSLSMKEYPPAVFESFGLTIIDEVHHISSQVFSNALFKIVTKYMLGLSATMNRKDGTTAVFKMFLGPVVYKCVRENEDNVLVRGYFYKSADSEFNEVPLDYRGQVMYSTMISKLCVCNDRNEYILNVLKNTLAANENQQVMILAHNKNILKYLHDTIKHREMATVGYYVGGMKEAALKESESKKVIIATYSMAAEALDIKTLTTLIMATPKTDIEQAVGRILREKHGTPLVIDIIDTHTPFRNQWNKRKAFYKKQNYKIVLCDSSDAPLVIPTNNKKSEEAEGEGEGEGEGDGEEEGEDNNKTNRKCLIDIQGFDED